MRQTLGLPSRPGATKTAREILFARYRKTAELRSRGYRLPDGWGVEYVETLLRCIASFRPSEGDFERYFERSLKRAYLKAARSASRRHHADEHASLAWAVRQRELAAEEHQIGEIIELLGELVAEWRAARVRARQRAKWADVAEAVLVDGATSSQAAARLGLTGGANEVDKILSRRVWPALRQRHREQTP